MENGFSFMPNYQQMASFFVHGETFDPQESLIFWQFASVAGVCEFSYWYISSAYQTFGQI